jgi:WD40 repeat protein
MHHAADAAHRSGNRQVCLKGTRKDVLLSIERWLMDEREQRVFWLNGPAGTGKSTISQTLAEMCFADGRLGASFFCSRDFEGRSDLHTIFPTLAFQLAYRYPTFRDELLQVLRTSPDVKRESLCSQMERVIVGPLKTTSIPTLIIIDGLDECKDEEPASAILSILSRYVDQIPDVKFFITGRPEPQIRSGFRLAALRPITEVFKLHNIERSSANTDIELFFSTRLPEVAKRRNNRGLIEGWPSPSNIDILCEKAAGLFIYASTVVKFAGSEGTPLAERLALITSLPQSSTEEENSSIDYLYMQVLEQAFRNVRTDGEEFYDRFRSVMGAVSLMCNPLPMRALSGLLGVSDIATTLRSLDSLVVVPNSVSDPVRVLHKSFPDFLTDPERCKDARFFINPSIHHREILLSCLELMKEGLKRNICGLNDYVPLDKVEDLPTRRKARIGDALEYACQFWARHLVGVPSCGHGVEEVHKAIDEFFTTRLLYWIEVLIVMRSLDVSLYAMNNIRQWYISVSYGLFVHRNLCSPLVQAGLICKWTDDSERFILDHIDAIRDSPSEIYHYVLSFSPSSSWIRECYSAELSREVKVVKGLRTEWGSCSRTVSLDYLPESLACCEDFIAVGLQSNEIIILDAIAGIRISVLSGHTDWVVSLAFSPDGAFLVSGSNDKTVKLWDIQTGGLVKTFCGHTDRVCSVSISPDRTTIASGSDDETLRLWDVRTGECRCIVDGHNRAVNSVSFSPTSPRLLMSASSHTVRQWDVDGRQIGPTYEGDDIAFSSDGARFVLRREGVATVRNSDSGVSVAELRLPCGQFNYCCLSPDGKLMAGAVFHTIYVWDITGSNPRLVETFVGHIQHISSLAFSSSLISVSVDRSIKFWQIGASSTEPVAIDSESTPDPPDPIRSISLQANEGIAISTDRLGVVKTWDISTGLCKASFYTPAYGFDWGDAQLIDGKLIFCWHEDTEIRLWDTEKEGFLQTVDLPWPYGGREIRISGDGSKVFLLSGKYIRAWSIRTGETTGKVELEDGLAYRPHITEGSRIWVRSEDSRSRGWEFGSVDSSPVPLPDSSLPKHDLDFIDRAREWNTDTSMIVDTVTGEEVFRLSGRYGRPAVGRWDGRYLVAGYASGAVLILDFENMIHR